MPDSTIADDLVRARSELVARGWCKHVLQDYEGNICALGAVHMAIIGRSDLSFNDDGFERCTDAQRVLAAVLEDRFLKSVSAFNDDIDTTQQDVLNLFDKALAELGALA